MALDNDYSPYQILNLNEDWGSDPKDTEAIEEQGHGRGFSGQALQTFLKSYLRKTLASGTLEGSNINFYNEDGEVVFQVPISSTIYYLTITSTLPSYVLDTQASAPVTFSYLSESSPLGSQERTPVIEGNVAYTLQVDSGTGFITVASGNIVGGSTGSVTIDIRPYLSSGINSIKMIMMGATSQKTSIITQTTNLTSFYLRSNYTYYQTWLGSDSAYYLNNLYFYGAFSKTLLISLKGTGYNQSATIDFNAATNYQSSPYRVDLTTLFSPVNSGVYEISFYMTGGSQTTTRYTYNIIYVAPGDEGLVYLTAINNVADTVVNYAESKAFDIIAYGRPTVSVQQFLTYNGIILHLPARTVGMTSNTAVDFITSLSEDIEAQEAEYTGTVSITGGNTVSATIDVDLSESYIPSPGYSFYLKSSAQSNTDTNRNTLLNQATMTYMPATFSNFAFCNDGWVTHNDRGALLVRAGSTLTTTLIPFGTDVSGGVTFELLFSVENTSDFTGTLFNALQSTIGLTCSADYFKVVCEGALDSVHQGFTVPQDEMLHLVVTVLPLYRGSRYNMCKIYINGIGIVSFQYATGSSFGSAPLVFNPSDSDLYIYLMRLYPRALDDTQIYNNLLNAASN